jgi:hypothetical protein
MKIESKIIWIICVSILSVGTANSQSFDDYRRQRQEEFNRHRAQNQERFENYRDSLNRRYADFLEQSWKRFALQKTEPFIKNPIAVPPVYDETKPQPVHEEVPVPESSVIPTPEPEVPVVKPIPEPSAIPDIEPAPAPVATINAVFFGTNIQLNNLKIHTTPLIGVSEKAIADYWRGLASIPYNGIAMSVVRIKFELSLNDWGKYQLLGKIFETYFPNGTENERVVFSVFMLNQMGYRAKIGRSGSELVPLIAFDNQVTNCMYFRYGDDASARYYVLNPKHKSLQSVETCAIDYDEGLSNLSLNVAESPKFASAPIVRDLGFSGKTYTLNINRNIIDFYEEYPCVEFSTYTDAPLDPLTLKSIEAAIRPEIAGKSQAEAVNWLLHFVQKAFEYKTDGDQFGYEKFFFAEETIGSSYSDCEDRSILFTQLVRRLLNMPVVLIYYPGIHLAAAVNFNDTTLSGDYVMVDGEKYLICDPTYINANIGMSMPDLRNMQIEVYR